MVPAVKRVQALEDFTLAIEFDNGERGVLDLSEYLDFGIFRRLRDKEAFRQVKVAFDTVEWESGPDLDPEFVYRHCTKTTPAGVKTRPQPTE